MAGLISVGVHWLALASSGSWLSERPLELAFPIEAHLAPPPKLLPDVAPPKPVKAIPQTLPAPQAPLSPPPMEENPLPPMPKGAEEVPAVAPSEDATPRGEEAERPVPMPAQTPVDVSKAPPSSDKLPEPEATQPAKLASAPLLKARRSLPGTARLVYRVGIGDQGFVAGRASYVWHSAEGRYSLVSTLEATGVAALFVQGRVVQVSEGTVDATGLRPEQYWIKRGQKKQETARFLWDQGRLDLGARYGMHELPAQTQDLLSFPFQFALIASEDLDRFEQSITNGRKLKTYGFEMRGVESIEISGASLRTLHVQGSREGEGALDVWLDPARSGLPVKVRTLDDKGKTMMLLLESLE